MTHERRRHLRVLVPGAYCELVVNGAPIGMVPIEDVSDSGVFVAFPRPTLPARTIVQLRFIEEDEPFTMEGVIAQVVNPGGARSPGYGIELTHPPPDTVERVVGRAERSLASSSERKPTTGTFPRTGASTPVSTSGAGAANASANPSASASANPSASTSTSATATASARPTAVILSANNGHGPAMARSLSLFGVETLFSSDPRAAMSHIDERMRVIFVELLLLEVTTGVALTHLRAAAPRARIMVVVEALPDVDRRAQLLKQGADELLVLPFDPFVVMGKIHGVARREPPKR